MRAKAAKAGDHLVGDQQDVVAVQHLLDRGPVALGRRHDAAGAKHRFADEGRDGVGPFAFDQRLQLGHAMGDEIRLDLVNVGAAIVIGRLGMQDLRQRQVELLVKQFKPGQRSGHQARAVIAAPARDDLLLLGPSKDVVVVPDQLDVGFVRV